MLTKIILADDHILLRDGLVTIINAFPECAVIAVGNNGTEVVTAIENGNIPDIVILDLNMPVMDGYATAKWLQLRHPEIKILILTMYDSEIALIRLLQTGVRGFLKKDIHPHELKNALLSVAEDGYYYSHQTIGKMGLLFKKSYERDNSINKALLNDVEIDFLKLASTDLTYKEIAQIMRLTPRIIDNYRDTLFDKLNVKSRVGMAIYAIKNGVAAF